MNDISTTSPDPALRTGLELARASQLTMLRLQLALHGSDRRAAMQALDTLLDMDAEMEGLASALPDGVSDMELARLIERQKAAIASEKHVLTGGDIPHLAIIAPGAGPYQFEVQEPPAGTPNRAGRGILILAIAVAMILICLGLAAFLWPPLRAVLK